MSLKRTSKVHTSPDAISHQDLPVPSTASGEVYYGPKCTSALFDSDLGISKEVDTCIPSLVASPDLSDVPTYSSEGKETLSCIESALSHAWTVLYEHSFQCDIKLHPPDKISLNSPQLSVSSASPESPFNKVAPVQHGSSHHNLYPILDTGKKEEYLSHLGDKAIGDENTHRLWLVP